MSFDAIIVGAGPNGLTAALALARAGLAVLVLEAEERPGGGLRTEELTLPGFRHDFCSSVHPFAAVSTPLSPHALGDPGVRWIRPEIPVSHPLDGGRAAALHGALGETARGLGGDGTAWERLFGPFVERFDDLATDLLAPPRWPAHPLLVAGFAAKGLRSAAGLARAAFRDEVARALFAGCAAHAVAPLEASPTAAFGLLLAAAGHAFGWPFAEGGSARIADALVASLAALGGAVRCGTPVHSLAEVPPARAVLLDLTPRQLLALAGDRIPARIRRAFERFRYGPGIFKLDWALDGPIPWTAPECARSGTVHLGGALEEVAAAELAPWEGRRPERPFVLLTQPSVCDSTRAPAGKHVAWGYCHIPNGATWDMTEGIERQVERFAPGFRDRILARRAWSPAEFERHDANMVGGDVTGGAMTLRQVLFRPRASPSPYRAGPPGLYICSASTPPGGGAHGLCGYHAARAVLADLAAGRLPRRAQA
ncbi:MAG TPA: NAD(P)/FAD-dependent oxidoreductase [Longimicrobiales bacterium]|nr:NAD(P)/FAD-dependent oxidoreductase [Longimicrobiales bacterium]